VLQLSALQDEVLGDLWDDVGSLSWMGKISAVYMKTLMMLCRLSARPMNVHRQLNPEKGFSRRTNS